jgi:hypothetical protein
VVAWYRNDVRSGHAERPKVTKKQTKEKLMPARAPPILRVARKQHAIQLPFASLQTLSKTTAHQLKRRFARLLLDCRDIDLVIIALKRHPGLREMGVGQVKKRREIWHDHL